MGKLLFVAIILLIFTLSNKKRKQGWKNPSTLLLLLYCISAILSIPNIAINGATSSSDYDLIFQDKYWIGALALTISLGLFMFPIFYFRENETKVIKLPSIQILDLFSTAIIILSLYAIIYYTPSVIKIFRSGIELRILRNSMAAREEYVSNGGILNTIASVSSSMYPFAGMLFYIYYIIGGHRIRCILLFISSTSNIIHVLTFIGRDGVIYWIITFLFLFFIFGNYLNFKQRKAMKRTLAIGSLVSLIPFFAISSSRFGGGAKAFGVFKGILSYIGQMIPNYLLYFDVKGSHYNYGVSFPLFWETIRKRPPNSIRWIDGGTESNVFGTFIKSFNTCFGFWGTILVGLVCGIVFIQIFKSRKPTISFHHYFIYLLYFQILSEGVFYFREYTRGGNLFIVICFFFYFLFGLIRKYFGETILQKNEITEELTKRKKFRIIIWR